MRNYSYQIEDKTISKVQYSVKQVIIGYLHIRYTADLEIAFDSTETIEDLNLYSWSDRKCI